MKAVPWVMAALTVLTASSVPAQETPPAPPAAEARAELERILNVRSSPEAYASYRDFVAGSQLESQVSLEEYSVSNRGLRSGLIGTPGQIIERLRDYERAGVGLMLLQFSPQREGMARFGAPVISRYSAPAL